MIYTKLFKTYYINIYNKLLSYIAIILILISSIYFTIKYKFLQFNIFKMYKAIKSSTKNDLMALFMSLGAKIGVGSIVGISIAIHKGGPGVLLWIWIISILSSILTFVETYLGIKYKNNNKSGVFYYIKEGINNKNLSIIYTIILISVYIFGFIGIQSNTIIKFTNNIFNINKYIIVIIICYIITIIINNKLNIIINIMSKIVPIMCILYISLCLIIIINNINSIKEVFIIIIKDGLRFERAILGTIIIGLKRGIFATETGLGTSSIASNIGSSDKYTQGLFQVIGVHFISLVIITITGIVIISNNYLITDNSIISLLIIFNKYYGIFGKLLLLTIVILFAISTIISGYYYSIEGLNFIRKTDNQYIIRIIVIFIIFLGGIAQSSIIWSLVDDLLLLLLIINIYTIICLRKK